jgi:hypothetical protein
MLKHDKGFFTGVTKGQLMCNSYIVTNTLNKPICIQHKIACIDFHMKNW